MTSRERSLGRVVRQRREHLRLTQNELARKVGVSRSEISEIENGRIRDPGAGVFAKLSRVLGLPGAVLLGATGYALGDPMLDVEADELLLLASSLVQIAGGDREWLKDRLTELRELITVRRSRTAKRPAAKRRRH